MGKVRVVIRWEVGRDVRKSRTIERSSGFAPMSL
jgi:hypothetical protein